MKILIVPMVGGRGIGPIYRSMAVANAAKEKHEILFLCKERFAPYVVKSGFNYVEDIEPTQKYPQGNILMWNDAAYAMGLCDENFVQKSFLHQLNVVKTFKPDIIFTEYNLTICAVANICNIPIVSTINWADTNEFSVDGKASKTLFPNAIEPYNEIFSKHSKSTYLDVSEMVTKIPALVAPTTKSQQPELEKYNVKYIGELLNRDYELDERLEVENENVYVYLTSCDLPAEEWVPIIITELSALKNPVYVVANDKVKQLLDGQHIPNNFHIKDFLPSLTVMKKSKLVIHAGSANVVSGALISGVPSLMIPLNDGERLYNALAVQKYICGKIIEKNQFFSKGYLLSAVKEIFASNKYYSNAAALGAEIISLGGAKTIVNYFYDVLKKQS